MLIFLKREKFDSVYRRSTTGTLVLIPHGWTTRYDYDDEVVATLWERYDGPAYDFAEHLGSRLKFPEDADDLRWCDRCAVPSATGDDYYAVDGDEHVCSSCIHNYWQCSACDEYHSSTTTTLHDTEVCQPCLDGYSWYYCDDHDGYYHGDDGCPESHSEDCDCEAPRQRFVIKLGDGSLLNNDQRHTVSLPAGTLSERGVYEIQCLLLQAAREVADDVTKIKFRRVAYDVLPAIDARWQTKEGNFTKRLARAAWKQEEVKITPDLLTKIGNTARQHSDGADFAIEVTRDLNLPAEEFAHDDSCWWQSYAYSRCMLKSNGGFGLRTFTEGAWGSGVTGRAWVMPLKADTFGNLVPTIQTEEPTAWAVFNGYGDLEGYAPARIMAQVAGMTYTKIGFSAGEAYINSNSAYLVGPAEVIDGVTSLNLDAATHSDLQYRESRDLVAA